MNLMKMPYRTSHFVMKGMLNILKLPTPPTLVGPGMIKRFPEIIALCNVHKAMIVTNEGLVSSGLLAPFMAELEKSGIAHVLYLLPDTPPTFEDIYNGLDLYYSESCDGIIAFGGGSVIDCGKVVAAKVTNDKPIPKMKGLFKLAHRLPPFFAVPTNAASGAEATIDALILDTTNCEKFTISDPKLAPLAAVLDAELCTGLSREATVTGALSTLTQAVESYLNRYDKNRVLDHAQSAVCSVLSTLEPLLKDPMNLKLRGEMLSAAHNAGLAKTRACPGYAQTIAHALDAWYGIGEARAAAATLPHVLRFNLETSRKRLADLALAAGLGEPADGDTLLSDRFVACIDDLYTRLNFSAFVPEIRLCDIPELTKQILKEANPAYPIPRLMDAQECSALLEALHLNQQ